MPEPDYYIRQGDGGVKISDTLKDASGTPVSIQGATVQFQVFPLSGGAALVSTTATNEQSGDGSDGSKGKVSYTWSTSNTAASGFYLGSWPVTFGGGAVQTFPNAGYILIDISPDPPTTAGTLYVQLAEIKATLEMSGTNFADADILSALNASCRAIDELADRRFYVDADANQVRYYSPTDPWVLDIDDLVTLTSLKTDSTGDGTFETTWATTDYLKEPLNAAAEGEPFTRLSTHPLGTQSFPTSYPRTVELTGKFGWPVVPAQIKQATTILTHRLLRRAREVPFGVSGIGLDGSVVRIMAQDPDVVALVTPFSRAVLVA